MLMILKGLYSSKLERSRVDKYISALMKIFGIIIREDTKYTKIKGFIISDVWYYVYFPKIANGSIISFRYEDMNYINQFYGIAEVKYFIKNAIKENPEKFIEFNKAMKGVLNGTN